MLYLNLILMLQKHKKILWGLGILLVLSPLGIMLPYLAHSGGAWGEWNSDEIKKYSGNVPQKLKDNEKIWKAPLENYQIAKNDKKPIIRSVYYVLSGIAGILIILGCTWCLIYYYRNHE